MFSEKKIPALYHYSSEQPHRARYKNKQCNIIQTAFVGNFAHFCYNSEKDLQHLAQGKEKSI